MSGRIGESVRRGRAAVTGFGGRTRGGPSDVSEVDALLPGYHGLRIVPRSTARDVEGPMHALLPCQSRLNLKISIEY